MPIKGLTDRGVAFPQIGNIRKGAKKTDPKRPGAELPYFRVEFDEREVQAIQKFNALYPDGKPTDIVVILPFDDIDRVWHAWREAYTSGALQHRCDGEYINYAINPQTGEVTVKDWHNAAGEMVKCERKDLTNKAQRCKPTGRLHIIIPQLERLAYLVVHTTSIWDVARISEQIAAIREMNSGHIAGIPLVLRRRPVEISTPSGDNGTRARRVKHMISIEADPEWVAAKLSAMRSAALPQVTPLPQLQAPISGPEWIENVGEDEDEEEIISGDAPDAESPEQPQMETDPAICKLHGDLIMTQSSTGLYYHVLPNGYYCNGVTTKPPKKQAAA